METENMKSMEEPIVDFVDQEEELLNRELEEATDLISQKCRELKAICKQTVSRIADDWRETNGNPYIRQTTTYKVEIFRNPNDETPIDTFQKTDVKSYSFRALAIATGVAAVIFCASGSIIKKMLTPGE